MIDSLRGLMPNAASEARRIDLRNQVVDKFREVNLDSSIAEGRKVIADARRIGYRRGEADALNGTASSLLMKGEFETAEEYLGAALELGTELEDSLLMSNTYSHLGMMYGMESKYDTSIAYFTKALAIYEARGDTGRMGRIYGNLAIGYQMQSNLPQALEYQQKALTIAEALGRLSSQSYALLNMGLIYHKIGDFDGAVAQLEKAIAMSKKANTKNVEVYAYSNLASLYSDKKDWDRTYEYASKAAVLARDMGDAPIEAASFSKAAVALAHLGRFEDAKAMIEEAMPDAEASGQPIVMCQLQTAMGLTLILEGKHAEAIPYYEKCVDTYAETDEYDENMANVFKELSSAYEHSGDYKNALAKFQQYAAVIDSVKRRDNVQKSTEMAMNYEFEKRRAEAAAAQAIKDAEAQRARNRQYYAMAFLGLVLLAVAVIAMMQYKSNKNKQKANLLLQSQKQKVEITLAELKATQAQLIQSEKMASLGELTAGIAHEIQNPLNFVNNFSEVSGELLAEMKEEMDNGQMVAAREIVDDVMENLAKINHHGRRADGIVKGMLQHSRTGSGMKEQVDLNTLTDEYLRLAYHGMRAKDKSFTVDMETDYDASLGKMEVVVQDMGRAILNLITNAFHACLVRARMERAAHPDTDQNPMTKTYRPLVSVKTKSEDGRVELTVTDNGIGIPDKVVGKIFQPFFTTKQAGEGTGLGLSLAYDVVKAHGGQLEVKSREGHGTEFKIIIPK